MLVDKTVSEFVDETASGTPVPGGGSVSALAGALAAALAAMVARLTIGKPGFEASEKHLTDICDSADGLRTELIRGVDLDAAAYRRFLQALRFPKATDAEKEKRQTELTAAKKEICRVPMAIAKSALKVLDLTAGAVRMGRKDIVTDSAVAVLLARAAARGALFNVKFNLAAVTDEVFVTQMRREAEKMERDVEEKEKETLAAVSV